MENYDHLSLDDGSLLTEQEIFVIENVVRGEFADMVLEFGPNTNNRQLRSSFLEKLLTGKFDNVAIHRIGVRIKNAIVYEPLNLENAVINNYINLRYFIFLSDVILRDSYFDKILSFTGSIFLKKADFHRIRVDKNLFLRGTIFDKSVNFAGASIGRSLEARDAQFNSKEDVAYFNSMQVGQSFNFLNTKFSSSIDLVYSTASNLFLRGTIDKPIYIEKIALRNASFERELEIKFIKISKLNLRDLQIKGPLILRNVEIDIELVLSYANLYSFKIDNVKLPEKNYSIILDGFTYRVISGGDKTDNWKNLFELIDKANFNIQNYTELENFYKRSGQQDKADEVYVKGKRRQLSKLRWFNPKRWATWLLWDKLTNYGRKPGRTIWVSIVIIIIGAFFFEPMLLKKETVLGCTWISHHDIYQNAIIRLIISFNQFLPSIDLGLSKELQFSNMSFYTFIYLQIHKICGWILIPIGLAAIYTKIK